MQLEPLIFNGINKDVSPNGLDYSGRKISNPLRDVVNSRYLSNEGGEAFQMENIKSNVKIVNPPLVAVTMPPLSSWVNAPWDQVNQSWGLGATPTLILNQSGQQSTPLIGTLTGFLPDTKYTFNIGWGNNAGQPIQVTLRAKLFRGDGSLIESFNATTVVVGAASSRVSSVIIRSLGETPAYIGIEIERDVSSVSGSRTFTLDSISMTNPAAFALPPGTNEVIGVYENREKNYLIYFIWNSTGKHRIQMYDENTGMISVIMEDIPGSSAVAPGRGLLNFRRDRLITGVSMTGSLLAFTDNAEFQKCINITHTYTASSDFRMSLLKIAPTKKPYVSLTSTSVPKDKDDIEPAVAVNRIAANSIQFAHRYVYLDNEVSALGPYSDLMPADAYGADRAFFTLRNKARVIFPIDTTLIGASLKRVELLFRIGNGPNWLIWKKLEAPFSANPAVEFLNDVPGEPVPTEQANKLFDLVPTRSRALVIFKNRLFLNVNEEGMTLPPMQITPSLTLDKNSIDVAVEGNGGFIKKNGQYRVGIVAADVFGRFTGVYAQTVLQGAPLVMTKSYKMMTSVSPDPNNRAARKMNVNMTGVLPPTVDRYSVVMSEDNHYESYFQTAARMDFYVRDRLAGEGDVGNTQVIENERIFLSNYSNYLTQAWAFCYFFLPVEIPFLPDTSYNIRIVNSENQRSVNKIIDVLDGYILVTNKFPGIDFANLFEPFLQTKPNFVGKKYGGIVTFIEIFKLKEVPSIYYYEVAGPFKNTSQGQAIQSSFTNLNGDTYYRGGYTAGLNPDSGVDMSQYNADVNYNSFRFLGTRFYGGGVNSNFPGKESSGLIQQETPSPVYIVGTLPPPKPTAIKAIKETEFKKKGYATDLSKIAWNRGRPFVEVTPQLVKRPTTIRYSDVYIDNTQLNGLNSFPVGNEYDKIGQDRSDIVAFLPVGNIMLAIHERNISSIYVGEGVVRTGEDGFLAKTDDVIGDDNKLVGGYGTLYPESLQENDGQAFGWDIYNGVVWRYTVEGIIPISNFGMKNHFRQKAAQYFAVKNSVRFVSAIDRVHKEYLLTFPDVASHGIAGETWAFNYEKNVWVARYSFIPEFMGKIGDKLYSFKNGEIWKHNAGTTYNNFYGVQYNRRFLISCNPQPEKVKTWSAVQLAGDNLCSSPGSDFKVVEIFNDSGQSTYTKAKDFEKKEGVHYGPILKDVNTNPALLTSGKIPLRDGKDMRSKALAVYVNNDSPERCLLQKMNIIYTFSEFSN